MTSDRNQHWYCAYLPVRTEHRAEGALRERGFDAYVPTEKHWTRHARKRIVSKRTIFPRYLFVRVEEGQSHYAVRDAVPGLSFVGLCGEPARIPSEWVIEIRENERAGHFDYTQTITPTFERNDPVRIIGGPFAGMLATIMQAKPGEARVKVLLKAMGRIGPGPAKVLATDLERAA